MTRWAAFGLAAVIAAGITMRLIFAGDIEYKRDERWTVEHVQSACATHQWPSAGLASSVGPEHPPMSAWVFIAPSCVLGITTPMGVARLVQVSAITALLLLVRFVVRLVPRDEREVWWWGVALAAVNPMAVHLQRKIWAPSILPIFAVLMLFAWWRRDRLLAAFLWGLVGIVAGQIHPSGFFFVAGFFLWGVFADRRPFAWRGALAGIAVGAVPMLPWLYGIVTHPIAMRAGRLMWWRPFELRFWRFWTYLPLGFGLWYPIDRGFRDFLAFPRIAGRSSWIVLGLHLALAVIAAAIAWRASRRFWSERARWREVLLGRDSATSSTLAAGWWGFGIVMTLSALPLLRHYLSIAFPLPFVFIAWVALRASRSPSEKRHDRAWLTALCVGQAMLTAIFLIYIHVNNGAPGSNYGVAYHAQVP